ncbi:SDR family NAD(P)-dependent oxidoreductase [Candidimonas nitroreducens]|uniref:Short-chain dehydrogenase n=1 Tax=Candidimonas nitroreducens TaxID=683354 RepID=A0A225MLB1_9BURK|nr:SDR family oxidoreductase [Candidimonas nitroreducens]OWT61732.1 short-chain dehydrogenase [Candidimonas nitroreducens]
MGNAISRSLVGKTFIITGGAQGMGRAMSMGIAREGANIIVVDIAEQACRELAQAITAAGDKALAVPGDICDIDVCHSVVDRAIAHFGAVHGVVNNAGRGMTAIRADYLDRPVPFWEVDPALWQSLMDLNTKAPFLMARAVAPHLVAQKWGRIVNVTTSLDTMYRAAYTPYGPSKAWLEAATVGWSRDLASHGVTCNALLPGGAVNTAFFDAHAPLDRSTLIQPDAMIPPICWLLSEDGGATTGYRFVARLWDASLPPSEAAMKCGSPAAWQSMGAQSLWPGARPVS